MDIAHPLYIDVPMMVSTLASLEDGLPATGALSALGIDLEGRIGATAAPTPGNAIAQRHTVASLFGKTRAALGGHVHAVNGAADLKKLEEGMFVEVSGPLVRNPAYEFVLVMERLFTIAQLGAAGVPNDLDVPAETRQVFNALRQELEATPVVDATLRTRQGLSVVVEFQKSYLKHALLDDLRFGRIRILGKLVGTLVEGERFNLLTKSLVGHMVSGAFDDALAGLKALNPSQDFPVATEVQGPGLLIVPMAAYI